MSDDINVLALVKGAERYIFLYDDANRAETLRTLGRYASNPQLSVYVVRRSRIEPTDSTGKPRGGSRRAPGGESDSTCRFRQTIRSGDA